MSDATCRTPAQAGVQSWVKIARGSAFGAVRGVWTPAFAGERVGVEA